MPGGAGDLDAVQQHVGGAAHGDGDRQGVAQRGGRDDVARPDAPLRHGEQAVDDLVGELGQAAGVVRRWGHHVQRLEPQDGDEGLHGVVGEHAPAAALARAGVQGVAGADLGVLVGHLEGRHEIDPVARLRVDPGPDGAVGEDDGRGVVLEDGGDGPDWGLVAGHDGDESGDAVRRQVDVGDVVDELPPDEGEPHLRRAVELAVGDAQGEHGRDQPDREVVVGDAAGQGGLDGLHLLGDAQIALAVAEVADHGPHRVVDLLDVLTEEGGRADPLHVAPGVDGHERDVGSSCYVMGGPHTAARLPVRRESAREPGSARVAASA